MAMYYCHHCDTYQDDDRSPGSEDPTSTGFDLICPDCLDEWLDEKEEDEDER